MSDTIGIIGLDGYAPVYSKDDRWTMWSVHDVYLGNIGKNKHIPKKNDYVVEPETGTVYIVSDVNDVTYVASLSPIKITESTLSDTMGSYSLDTYRLYYDKSVTPYTLAPEGIMRIYSSTAAYARIYRGTLLNDNMIISRRYDNSGNLIGFDVPLQMASYLTQQNQAVKIAPTCSTAENLNDGEVCTIVFYDTDGKVVWKTHALVESTTYVTPAYADQKYITQLFLKTPFMSATDTSDIYYPVNLPIASFNPIGVVQYNDGSQSEYPVDGDKFSIYGLDQFTSTIVGHRVPLVLSYRMSPDEAGLTTVRTDFNYITKDYTLIVSEPNTSYNVKVFVYPSWVDGINGYKLRAFLLNLDRNIVIDISDKLALASNSASFNPLAYGLSQRLTLNINLSTVSSVYSNFLHVQTVDVILRAPATDSSVNNIWEVNSQVPGTVYYGSELRASIVNSANTGIVIHSGIETVDQFIAKVYLSTNPQYNPLTELGPLTPTHVKVIYGNESKVIDISDFRNSITFNTVIGLYTNVDLVFMKNSPNGYLTLGVASLTVR